MKAKAGELLESFIESLKSVVYFLHRKWREDQNEMDWSLGAILYFNCRQDGSVAEFGADNSQFSLLPPHQK